MEDWHVFSLSSFFFLRSPIVLLIKVASVRALPIEPEAMLADAPQSRRNFSDSTA